MGMQESSHVVEKRDPSGSHPAARREFFKAASMVGAGLVIGGTGTLSAAQADTLLPVNTPVPQLHFDEEEVRLLTPSIRRLTKQDLHDMREAGFQQVDKTMRQFLAEYKTKGGLTVSVEDIRSLHRANSARYMKLHHAKAVSISCCCCTPCCSCCASVVTQPLVARVA